MNQETVLLPISHELVNEALSLVCRQFTKGSILHNAVDIGVAEYKPYIEEHFRSSIEEELSVVALNTETGSVVGCLIAIDFPPKQANIEAVPRKFRPIKALLTDLEDMYTQSQDIVPGQCMLVDLAIVSDKARGQGIYSKLRNAVHEIGLKRGYERVVGELSSETTQYVCVKKLGHTIKAEIAYSDFLYGGSYPFKEIRTPPSIQLVEGLLATS